MQRCKEGEREKRRETTDVQNVRDREGARERKSLSSLFAAVPVAFCNGHFAFLPRSRPLNGFEPNEKGTRTTIDTEEEEEDKELSISRKIRRGSQSIFVLLASLIC